METPDFPNLPKPEARIAMSVIFPGDEEELLPGHLDTVEAEVTRQAKDLGVSQGMVSVHQEVDRTPVGSGEPNELRSLTFRFPERTMDFEQMRKARRAILGTLNDYDLTAREENILVQATVPIDLGDL